MNRTITLGELELATIITALRAWRLSVERDDYDSALIDESIGVLTHKEIGDLLVMLEKDGE